MDIPRHTAYELRPIPGAGGAVSGTGIRHLVSHDCSATESRVNTIGVGEPKVKEDGGKGTRSEVYIVGWVVRALLLSAQSEGGRPRTASWWRGTEAG